MDWNSIISLSIISVVLSLASHTVQGGQIPQTFQNQLFEHKSQTQYKYDEAHSSQQWPSYVDVMPVQLSGRKDKHAEDMSSCTLSCKYGFVSDIEGSSICKCHQPCQSVQCFGGTECQAERVCSYETGCSYQAVCKVVDDVCSLRRPKHTFICEKLSRKFYFDSKKGRCRKYWGCDDIVGNSFETKKECKRTCGDNSANRNKDRSRSNSRKHLTEFTDNKIPMIKEFAPETELKMPVPPEPTRHINELPDSNEYQPPKLRRPQRPVSNDIKTHQAMNPHIAEDQNVASHERSCLFEDPYEPCPYDQCAHCSSQEVVCLPSLCGKCNAIYIDLNTGIISNQYANYC